MKILILEAVHGVLWRVLSWLERLEAALDDRLTLLELRKNYRGKS